MEQDRTPPDLDDDEIDLIVLFTVLWRERRFIVAFSLGVAFVAAAFSFIPTPMFKAEVVTQIKGSHAGAGMSALAGLASAAGVLPAGAGGDETLVANTGTLQSKELMRDFVRSQKIEAALLNEDGFSLSKFLGLSDEAPDSAKRLELAREVFEKSVMSIEADKKSGLTTITIKWKDPKVAADWANGFIVMANNEVRGVSIDRARKNLESLHAELPKTAAVEVQQAIYNVIEDQVKTIMMATTQPEFAFQVIDPAAAPVRRYWPKRGLIVILATLVAGMISVGVVLVRARHFPTKPWPFKFLNSTPGA
ncbi:MAG: Wzz/FepE/Etk N-terminal domain-containing protein [Rhodocyclaceae bacterium]|nr:Wzz/FepE/Etk N-terminal domain-containing protein [Rhodocyclaceae bacterium]